MADVHIPREAVEAAARKIHTPFDHCHPLEQHRAREAAMDALNAAAPLIVAAELDQWAAEFEADVPKYQGLNFDHGQPFRASSVLRGRADHLRARAAELRAQS